MLTIEIYESEIEESITAICENDSNRELLIPKDGRLLRKITAENWDECMKKHHELMGWEPYQSYKTK